MKALVPILTALLLLGAAPALAGERDGRGGGGCGGGCHPGGGHPGPGGGYPGGGYNTNVNVNVNANVNASAGAYAGAGASINARAYDVGSISPRGPVHGGVVSTGGDFGYGAVSGYSYGYGGGYGPVVITGPGYGPSRPFGYVVSGFGRRYVTTDRCGGGCGPTPPPPLTCRERCDHRPPPPPSCYDPCRDGGHRRPHGASHGQRYSGSVSGSSYSVRESYSESASYSGAYQGGYASGDRYSVQDDDGPRYAPIPYHAAPLEPVTDHPGYGPQAPHDAPPPVHYSEPANLPAPGDFQGDLPPGDTGEGMPYRQEPGERG